MPATTVERLLYPIPDAARMLACGRSTIYQLIARGELDARKLGGKTVITAASIAARADALPKAGIKLRA